MRQIKTLAAKTATPSVARTRRDVLQPATRVIVQNVGAKPELIGGVGAVRKFDDAKGRYAVTLEGQYDQVIALKPQNVIQMIGDV